MNKPVPPMSSLSLKLPTADRSIETYRLAASRTFPAKLEGTLNRVAFSAAHVVADPLADNDPWLNAAIDWDRTIAFREHVWDLGLEEAGRIETFTPREHEPEGQRRYRKGDAGEAFHPALLNPCCPWCPAPSASRRESAWREGSAHRSR